jgi:nitrogen PTS system EIIA component
MDLKIKDVADLLNVSETTIRRWLSDGKIPAYKINHQYRFNRLEIEDWVMGQRVSTTPESLTFDKKERNSEESPSKSGRQQFSLYRAIHQGGVFFDINGETKNELIKNTMKKVAKSIHLDPEVITELLLERENLQSTALNQGIALPHTRECPIQAGRDAVFVVFPKHPIDYEALDDQPVHSLFFLFASDDKKHLHLLAKIAHFSTQNEARAFLQTKPNKDQLLEYVKEWESCIQKV